MTDAQCHCQEAGSEGDSWGEDTAVTEAEWIGRTWRMTGGGGGGGQGHMAGTRVCRGQDTKSLQLHPRGLSKDGKQWGAIGSC